MAQNEQLSLSWDSHQKSICNGLSQLQQRGEFVDMTLAADGHHVKVHQMVMSLVSPYIKELISTTKSPHPIIFLNNISYTTLSAILEYIYTGEVLVPKNLLQDVIAAGKALHIRGLREMDVGTTADPDLIMKTNLSPTKPTSISERLRQIKEKKKLETLATSEEPPKEDKTIVRPPPMCKIYLDDNSGWSAEDINDTSMDMDTHNDTTEVGETTLDTSALSLNSSNIGKSDRSKVINRNMTADETRNALLNAKVQYTVSNQGGLQSIYNRYMYQLRYISRDRKVSWRCIDYNKTRCKANIFTNDDDEVVDRTFSHNHPFHDKNILRKHRIGIVYSEFKDASIKSKSKKNNVPMRDIMDEDLLSQKIHFTVSNQGGLQIIHNRYIYNMRYFGKRNRKRFWRCVDYSNPVLKCPATICTYENNQVSERSYTHNHGFHDNKILKKMQDGVVYSIFQEAESLADDKKKERRVPPTVDDSSD